MKNILLFIAILTINIFILMGAFYFFSEARFSQRFENEPTAFAHVYEYSKEYRKQRNIKFVRTDLQFKTPQNRVIYLKDIQITKQEKAVLQQGGYIVREYLVTQPQHVRPKAGKAANYAMTFIFSAVFLFNTIYMFVRWHPNRQT